jgi:hypothetical protein
MIPKNGVKVINKCPVTNTLANSAENLYPLMIMAVPSVGKLTL